MDGNFDFSTETYEEPVVNEMTPFMTTSGYVKGNITKCVYNASNNCVDIDQLGTQNKKPVLASKMKLFLENKDGTKSSGYYMFMSICQLVGLNKIERDGFTGEYKDLIGKEIVFGIQLKVSEGYDVPLRNIKSVHDPVTGQTLGEKNANKKAEAIHVKLTDWIEKPQQQTTVKQDFATDEPPLGFGSQPQNGFSQPPADINNALPQMPVDEDLDLPF